jgi:hypothetical protein
MFAVWPQFLKIALNRRAGFASVHFRVSANR